jgi:hypothetical protein
LIQRGHDVTRTPNPWIGENASDLEQLLAATAQGRVIFTFNMRDFVPLTRRFPAYGGVILAAQSRWRFPDLIGALDRSLTESESDALRGQVRWLNDWRRRPTERDEH